LPGEVGDILLNELMAVGEERPWSGLETWAALSYTGA
jgi:hypothetical protein